MTGQPLRVPSAPPVPFVLEEFGRLKADSAVALGFEFAIRYPLFAIALTGHRDPGDEGVRISGAPAFVLEEFVRLKAASANSPIGFNSLSAIRYASCRLPTSPSGFRPRFHRGASFPARPRFSGAYEKVRPGTVFLASKEAGSLVLRHLCWKSSGV